MMKYRWQNPFFSVIQPIRAVGFPLLALVFILVSGGLAPQNSQPLEMETVWEYQIVDHATGNLHSSLAFDSTNRPHIAYFGSGDLRYAYRTDTAWEIEIVDSVGETTPSLTLDSLDMPHILYGSSINGTLYASWTGSVWDIQTIDSQYGFGLSLILDSANQPHATYTVYNSTTWEYELMYAYWTGSTWNTQLVTTNAGNSSLAVDSNDNPHISYASGNTVNYAHYDGDVWLFQTVVDSDQQVFSTDIVLDSFAHPHISYSCYADLRA